VSARAAHALARDTLGMMGIIEALKVGLQLSETENVCASRITSTDFTSCLQGCVIPFLRDSVV